MAFLSELRGQKVWDGAGRQIGRCRDILVSELERDYPPVSGLAISDGTQGELRLIPVEEIEWLGKPAILLRSTGADIPLLQPTGHELWLARSVLDRQIVDTEGRRVVRVNDLELARVGERYCLVAVDVGAWGLVRRLGLEGAARALFALGKREPPLTLIPWQDVAPLQVEAPLKLRVSRDKISKLHPADIAEIVSNLNRPMRHALMQSLDDEVMADALEEIEPQLQVAVLERLDRERAADILEEMTPDDAADLLAELPAQESAQLLDMMEAEEAGDVRRLLAYPEESAGGIMTTEYAIVPEELTVAQAIEYLRQSEEAREAETIYYVYVTDAASRLKGAIDLRDLIMASPDSKVTSHMHHNVATVDLYTEQREVARVIAKYNILAVPVVDQEGILHGIVTVDDAIDAIIPTAWKKRLPRIF